MKSALHGLGLAAALLLGTAASQPAAAFPANLASCQVASCGAENEGLVQEVRSKGQWRHGGHGWNGNRWHGRWGHRWHGGHGHRWGGGGFGFYPGYYGYPYAGVYGYDPYDYGYGYGDGYSIWSDVDTPDAVDDGDYTQQGDSDYIRYCSQKYRSFNPSTGMYRLYSGEYKRCVYRG
ncbi:MAG: BA14K family protein [Parvibaculaceae bacterium]